MYAKRTIFDLVLPRIMAGERLSGKDIFVLKLIQILSKENAVRRECHLLCPRKALYHPHKLRTAGTHQRINAHEWEALLQLAKENPLDVRFIEMMPIGCGRKQEGIEGNHSYILQ